MWLEIYIVLDTHNKCKSRNFTIQWFLVSTTSYQNTALAPCPWGTFS